VHIAEEETKFGFDIAALPQVLNEISAAKLSAARVCGLMGMASFTNNAEKIKQEFHSIKMLFEQLALNQKTFNILSTGMSADFTIALEEGSTMVRIGSLLFGERKKFRLIIILRSPFFQVFQLYHHHSAHWFFTSIGNYFHSNRICRRSKRLSIFRVKIIRERIVEAVINIKVIDFGAKGNL